MGRRCVARSRFGTPGSTHARRSCGRTSTILVMRAVTTTSESPIGVAAPARPVPLPRGTIGRPCAAAMRTHACTCSVVVGKATSAQPPSTIEASRAYRRSARGSESTASAPSTASSSCRAASTSAMDRRLPLPDGTPGRAAPGAGSGGLRRRARESRRRPGRAGPRRPRLPCRPRRCRPRSHGPAASSSRARCGCPCGR